MLVPEAGQRGFGIGEVKGAGAGGRAAGFCYQRGKKCWCRKAGQRGFVTNAVT